MSNSKSNVEQDRLIEQSENQRNPGLARPEDFEVNETYDPKPSLPHHGQCGDTVAEYESLLSESNSRGGKSSTTPTPTRNDVDARK